MIARSRSVLLAALLVVATGPAWAADAAAQAAGPVRPDAAKGKEIASTLCVACHGADGNSTIAVNPKLAQQHPDYLYKQLVNFAPSPRLGRATRDNAVMLGFASQLSDADKRNVAAWYGAQKQTEGYATDKATLELGQRIWRAGIPERQLPACAGCHSPDGSGIPSQYPRLAGQHADYVVAQLRAFRDGTRRNNLAMQQISPKLSDAEMAAVANYAQGLRR